MNTLVRSHVRPLLTAVLLLLATTWLLATRASTTARTAAKTMTVTHDLARVRLKAGPVIEALDVGPVQPLSLGAADFDEDGVPDLVAGVVAGDLPLLGLYRGNMGSIYGDGSGSSPFFAPVKVELAIVPDFLATGDFDADGHLDVAAASRQSHVLAWLRGDGYGAFERAQLIELPAAAIGMVAGELNRDDGLADLAVAVAGEHGAHVLLFTGPSGALNSTPGTVSLPAPPTQLTMGHFDRDMSGDLAVVVGDELLIYHGEDGSSAGGRSLGAAAPVSRHALGVRAVAMAVGRFDTDSAAGVALVDGDGAVHTVTRRGGPAETWRRATVARSTDAAQDWTLQETLPTLLASARISASGTDDVVVVDRRHRRVAIVPTAPTAIGGGALSAQPAAVVELARAPMAVLPMRLDGDATTDLVIFEEGAEGPSVLLAVAGRTFTVNLATDEPDCDITDNSCRIGPVDAEGKCTGGCTFRAALNEANVSGDLDTIEFALGGGTPVIVKQGGADWTATSPVTINGNTGGASRVHLDARGSGNTLIVRGGSSAIRNLVITGGSAALSVSTNGGNIFEGNWIGLDPTGSTAPGNPGPGIFVTSSMNTIGGTLSAARNIISGSGLNGIEIRNATGNRVIGNYIGTDVTGTRDLGNALSGIYVELAGSTTIGGTAAGSRNVISGNDHTVNGGILANISPNLVVQGNYIGTSATGNAPLGNAGPGLRIVSGSNDVIGGTTAAARNVIAANGADGVIIRSIGVSAKTLVQGNYIGVAANGALLGNGGFGIAVQGTHDNTIGGTATGARNVIGGNRTAGVALQFAGVQPGGNAVRGNSIASNGGLGIDLGADGVTANDACDADTGANGRQNAPVVTSAPGLGAVRGTLNSKPSTTFLLDFYSSPGVDPSGYGEGQAYLGSTNVATDAGCLANFSVTFKQPIPAGHFVTATATDPANNTSEFSAAVLVPGAIDVTLPNTAVNWAIGSAQKIQWSHNLGAKSFVKVEISRDGGATFSVIAASTKNGSGSGTFNWTVTGPATTQARIRVTSVSDPSISDVSNVNATIAEPFMTVTRPNLSSHTWGIGTTQTIQWSSNLGKLENVVIELSRDGGVTYPIVLLPATPSDGKQAITVQAGWATPTARVRITWVRSASVSDSSDQSFAIQ